MIKFDYLYDKSFLKKFDLEPHKIIYLKIIALDFSTENPIASLEGVSTGGNITLSGTSNMRRVANCSMVVNPFGLQLAGTSTFENYANITEINNIISMGKKIQLEVGVENSLKDLDYYPNEEIIWFPFGVYIIKTASISYNNSGLNISLNLNDKCALVNGDSGGIIPATVIFSEKEIYDSTGLNRKVEKVLIRDIIFELLVELGGLSPDKILIEDIDDAIVKIMKWVGDKPIYGIEEIKDDQIKITRLTKEKPESSQYKEFIYGQDIGRSIEPFVYPGTLECKTGETISSVLDKIRNILGNFEWFFDVDGRFIFREKKNYLNKSLSTKILELSKNDYFPNANLSMEEYSFDSETNKLLVSISNAPSYQNIKNDFIVWGSRKLSSGIDRPIRYRLVFQEKPLAGKVRFAFVYNDSTNLQKVVILNENNYKKINSSTSANKHDIYYNFQGSIYHWDELNNNYTKIQGVLCYLQSKDWRTELFYRGLDGTATAEENPYAAELNAEWTKICDVLANNIGNSSDGLPIYSDALRNEENFSGYDYWLDFIEGQDFDVSRIGRRTKVVTEKDVNCLFPTEIPNYTYIEANGEKDRIDTERKEIKEDQGALIQVSSAIYQQMTIGGGQNSAFDKIKELVWIHSTYNESISLSAIPIYHLEPGMLLKIFNKDTGIDGNYEIKSMTIPLTTSGTMSISATKCLEKF